MLCYIFEGVKHVESSDIGIGDLIVIEKVRHMSLQIMVIFNLKIQINKYTKAYFILISNHIYAYCVLN